MATLPEETTEYKNIMSKTTQTDLEFTTEASMEKSGCSVEDISSSAALAYLVILIGFALMFENSLLIVIIRRTRCLPTITNILVASTGFSDVLAGVQCCFMGMFTLPGGFESWLKSTRVDKHTFASAMIGINCSLMVVSMAHVSLLAIDRYLHVLWPFHYYQRVTKPRVLGIVITIWILALGYFCLLVLQFQRDEYREMCIISEVPTVYSYYPIVLQYYFCFTVVCVCTFGITKRALDHRRRRRSRNAPQTEARIRHFDTNGDVHGKSFYRNHKKPAARSAGTRNNSHGLWKKRGYVDPIKAPISLILWSNINKIAENCLTPFEDNFRFMNECHSEQSSIYSVPVSSKMENLTQNVAFNLDLKTISPNLTLEKTQKRSFDLAVADTESENLSSGARGVQKLTKEDNNDEKATSTSSSAENTPSSNYNVAGDTRKRLEFPKNDPRDCNKPEDGLFNKANLKIIKFVLVVFGSFFLCTFPSIVLITIVKIMNIPVLSQDDIEFEVMHFFLVFNSGMNFLIITYMNKDFRTALAKTLPCCRICCAKNDIKRRKKYFL
ncbi:beta-1 adrenergic receptor [Plakobranchus ocellatus]|uniref:Beta-1 adrenergic receptor n=1 Tax=Plakobranchus ocellatus TaxID=259542 RepID=A0AAV4BSM2_9GAST|nr:beta-1 adrenergic receptor [Plakobranchus ocellatus]